MADGEAYLDWIAGELKAGRRQWKRGDKILAAFGYTRRRQTAVDLINGALDARGMYTTPELSTDMPLDRAIRFHLKNGTPDSTAAEPPSLVEVEPAQVEVLEVADSAGHGAQETVTIEVEPPSADPEVPPEKALIVGNLASAEKVPLQISPTSSVAEALTLMDLHDYSHLVVTTGPRDVKGVISHKSIARAFLLGKAECVNDCLDSSAPKVERDASLLSVVGLFESHDVVLVVGPDKAIAGIVTPWDIAVEFNAMAGPFLMIGQIEDQLRWLVRTRHLDLGAAFAASMQDQSHPVSVDDLTMGELQRVLEHPENWNKVGIGYDRKAFCGELNAVREIRNAVMHFRDPDDPNPFGRVRDFANVVQRAFRAATAK